MSYKTKLRIIKLVRCMSFAIVGGILALYHFYADSWLFRIILVCMIINEVTSMEYMRVSEKEEENKNYE